MLSRQELLGAFLRDRRKFLGLSQDQVSAQIGIDASRLSRIETGDRLPTLHEIPLFASVLKVDVLSILAAFRIIVGPVDFTRIPEVLIRGLRELDDRGLEVLAYTARGLLPLQSPEPEPPSDSGHIDPGE